MRVSGILIGFVIVFFVATLGFALKSNINFDQSVAECVADIGPAPDVKDYCEALVRTDRTWK